MVMKLVMLAFFVKIYINTGPHIQAGVISGFYNIRYNLQAAFHLTTGLIVFECNV